MKTTKQLILSENITDFTTAYANITAWYNGISADIFAKFCHKALAECHYISVRFAFRIKVGTAFSAADRKTSERIFENLLKA